MELRNKKILCLVTLPDSLVLAIDCDRTANGREVLKQVCEKIGSIETDFFGLQYISSCGELLWLNLRNRVTAELPGSSPYRIELKIKFFVQPHCVQQEYTRNQFYITARNDFISETLRVESVDKVLHLSALVAQSELSPDSSHSPSHIETIEACLPIQHRTTDNISYVRQKLGLLNSKSARNQFLRDVAELTMYGIHDHQARDDKLDKHLHVGIGPKGITLSDEQWKTVQHIPFRALQRAIHDCLSVDILVIQDDASIRYHRLTLANNSTANALYRDLTEMYSFFHCDTVGTIVAEQFCRDLKGIIVSLFSEKRDLGKKYVFDIERTLRETFDRTSRLLFAAGGEQISIVDDSTLNKETDVENSSPQCHSKVVQQLHDIHSAFTCQICADSEICTVFVPCGHMTCCTDCSKRLSSCPLCKQSINLVQPVYLPSNRPEITSPGISLVSCK